MLRYMLSILLESQSKATLSDGQRYSCKQGIKALKAAIDAMENQLHA